MMLHEPHAPTWRAAVRAWLFAIALSLASVMTPDARADTPPDVVSGETSALLIPERPESYEWEQTEGVTWEYHPSSASIVRDLQAALPQVLRSIERELGSAARDDLVVRIAKGPEDMARLAPQNAPPPSYAVGVAYPALGLIVLSVVAPDSWLPPDIQRVFVHELSHVSVYRAANGNRLPLWFVEGLAVHQAGEQNLSRIRTLWEAAVVGEILPLSELSQRFPTRPHQVNRAYAQSADLVEHLLRTTDDRAALPELLAHVASGKSFEDAVLATYRTDLATIDREWRQALSERFRVLPLVLTGTALWGGIAMLAVVAFVRRRRQHHEKLRRWGDEEAAYERALAALELQRQMNLREELALRQGYPLPVPLPREPGVPTVEHDGQRYTLH